MAGAATLAQELSQQVLGRQLSVAEFASLLSVSGDPVVDSANGAANVRATGLNYSRLDFVKLFDAIAAMSGVTAPPSGSTTPARGGGSITPATSASRFATVTVAEGQAVTGVNFGNFITGSISGTVFLDTNGDGTHEHGETAPRGITVFLDTAGTGVLQAGDPQAVTNSAGQFSFTGLTAGSYSVREVVPAGDVETTADPVTVSMTSGLAATVDFGVFQQGAISGTGFLHATGGGAKGSGEAGLSGRTRFIR